MNVERQYGGVLSGSKDGFKFLLLLFKMELRKSAVIPIINENHLIEITGSQFPTNLDVFRHYKFLLKSHDAAEAKVKVAVAAEGFWTKVGVKPKARQCIIKDVTNLDKEYSVIAN